MSVYKSNYQKSGHAQEKFSMKGPCAFFGGIVEAVKGQKIVFPKKSVFISFSFYLYFHWILRIEISLIENFRLKMYRGSREMINEK